MRGSQLLIYIVFHLCALFTNVYCEEADIIDDVTPATPELGKDLHSFFYMAPEDDLPSPVPETRKNEQSLTMAQPCRELDERSTQEGIFYKRLVTILLANLAIQRIDDRLIGTLNIEAPTSQFEYLQNFVNQGQGSIREVDRILDSAIKQSEYSACHYMTEVSRYFNLFVSKASEYFTYCLLFLKEHGEITVISFTVIAIFMILRRKRCSRGLLIFLMFDVIFAISFFITWWRLIQEAEIKLMAKQAQFAEMPIACQPHKMNLWNKMITTVFENLFTTNNDCERYYETIMMNPRLQVTPAQALTHLFSSVVFQPFSYFGLVISEFIDNATSKLNFLCKFPIVIVLFLTFCVCMILIPFSWIGGSINFGIGPFFKFGMRGRQNLNEKKERIERIREETSSPMRLEDSEKMKQITFEQDNDPAGGDAGTDTQHLRERRKKIKCKSKNGDGDIVCEKDGHC
ncbi:PREDICTED: uncharacterized protein LOC105568987 isoform X2 [Vollenhovia emeryi]|uniref:uncharacterized protein LOC105568987 isoform X2 n=1 Tax=Vollenhovia emeryi TaxID=411798 RepID=UPI0005F3B322|nr:PREDICTED: uncharacterized protein LOC105568987 isoform X2 [Vollenhovia emeryi]